MMHSRRTASSATRVARAAAGARSFAAASAPRSQHAQTQTAVHPNAAPSYTPSFMEKLFSGSRTPRVPLDVPWPSIPSLSTPAAPTTGAAQLSTLPSGIRVVTLPSSSPIASVGVFVDGGSRYENVENNGITHFVELMSFKSTKNRSDFRLVRDMLKLGANVSASSGREHLIYTSDVLAEHVPHVLGTLGDVMLNNSYDAQELLEERESYLQASENRSKIVGLNLMESIHEAAYNGTGLGLSLYAPAHNLDTFDAHTLKNYTRQLFTPKRMVVSAVGVDHEHLRQMTQEVFKSLSSDASQEAPRLPAVYTGGEVRMHHRGSEGDGRTHFALAFETASWHSKDLVAMCVLQMMMGGGGSFSAGGPGKGMYSRLYTNVLNKYEFAESCTCFNSIFSDSSLFGIYGVCVPDKAAQLVDVISKEIVRMTGPVDSTELTRAKNQLRSAVYMQLEARTLKLEDTGRQVMTYGRVQSPAEVSQQIQAVTPEDIQRVAKAMLATPITVAAAGDLTQLPRYEHIQRAFK